MRRVIQIRKVPAVLHRRLKSRAADVGMSLSEYLLGELREIAERPTLAEFRDHLRTRKQIRRVLNTADLRRARGHA